MKVWNADTTAEANVPERVDIFGTPDGAAELFAAEEWSTSGQSSYRIHVRDDDGRLWVFEVLVRMVPQFSAIRVEVS